MAGFRKAKAEQAALKVGIYGAPGSGKTFSTLLFAEGLAKITGKRIAYIDTERGTDFYCQTVAERNVHPQAFDFDALYTKSITEIVAEVRNLDPAVHGVVVIDSITHVWEAARNAYNGRLNKAGQIPFHAWAGIKKPYKDLMAMLLSSPMHAFILGRQGNEFETDEETGEMKKVGVKMKAEGETAYEPHILLRMEAERDRAGKTVPTIYVEKDRTGILSGKTIVWPSFDGVVKPLLGLLGATQAKVESDEEVGAKDAEKMTAEDQRREELSIDILRRFSARFDIAASEKDVAAIAAEITPALKKDMLGADLASLREKWVQAEKRTKGKAA